MIGLVYNNKFFNILDNYGISNSVKDVTFNDIKIDFTGYTFEDTPMKYQEVQIKDCEDINNPSNGKVLFFGYVDSFKFGKMKLAEEDRELTITLLSPRKLATLRSTSITGTYSLKAGIIKIFEPLINDGFIISEINVPDGQMLMSYILQPIETIMNDICNKRNLVWTIDENKNIKVNSLTYLFGQNEAKIINNATEEGKNGFIDISPEMQSSDYANVINIKNARLIYRDTTTVVNNVVNEYGGFPILTLPKTIKQGDSINFNHPVTLGKKIGKQIYLEKGGEYYEPIVMLELRLNNFYLLIAYNPYTDTMSTTVEGGTVTYSDNNGEEGTLVLQRDSFFKDVITGIKWNGNNNTIISTDTESALRYVTMKFMHSAEIEKLKGLISQTGQIEKNIDANETWFTLPELTNYARNLLVKNKNIINKITLKYDKDQSLNVGDLISIDLPQFYVNGTFAVTEKRVLYVNEDDITYTYILQNSDVINSYIDIFRPVKKQETETQEHSLIISEFTEEELKEIHTIKEVSDED